LGGLVRFPRAGTRQSDAEGHDPADNALRSRRKVSEASLVTWIDATRLRDGDDDRDGGGGAAA
jgi:hypothetical protein